jgi:hypothetical protein
MKTTGISVFADMISTANKEALIKFSDGQPKLIKNNINEKFNKLQFNILDERLEDAKRLIRYHQIAWEPAT